MFELFVKRKEGGNVPVRQMKCCLFSIKLLNLMEKRQHSFWSVSVGCHPAAVVVLTIGLWLIQPPCLSFLSMLTWLKCFIEKNRTSIDLSSIGDFGPFASIFLSKPGFQYHSSLIYPSREKPDLFYIPLQAHLKTADEIPLLFPEH